MKHSSDLMLWLLVSVLPGYFPLFEGCVSTREVSSAEVECNPDQRITVELKDGREITYADGKYSIGGDTLRFIHGEGTLQPSGKLFTDSLSVNQIQKITTHRYTPVFYTLFVLGGLGIAAFFITLFIGFSPGG